LALNIEDDEDNIYLINQDEDKADELTLYLEEKRIIRNISNFKYFKSLKS
jgi:hypothetical protein